MNKRSLWLALLVGISLAFGMTTSVAATSKPGHGHITVTPEKETLTCGHWYTVRATVLDKNGHPIVGVRVHWSFKRSPSRRDRIQPLSSKTGSKGVAKTKVKLACVPGNRYITAKYKSLRGSAVVHVKIPHKRSTSSSSAASGAVLGVTSNSDPGSLPSTSTVAPVAATEAPPTPAAPIVPLLIAFLASLAFILRRLAISR